ncbi:hypothetical protein S225a_08040 [Candidatus Brocadiaceae bacterium S225]|uniref:Lipoprotein n=1 Tax=Candidatus Scalindua brodae TaxID=237368 RepID=A0A0B0EEK5_9BACT|nr:MAG: hypothetical protein SCABRO_03192 [Candidatus Scalindua brodae]TWU35441.1 hypothetical protein S225a_08040 [Candidatus Brocadiaceae bacterium S225]
MTTFTRLMKRIIIVLLTTHLLIGCSSFKPVSKMSDWQLRQEYLDVQYKLSEIKSRHNLLANETAGYINNYANVASQLVPYPGIYNSSVRSVVSEGDKVRLKNDIATLSERLSKLRLEMSKRGIYSP